MVDTPSAVIESSRDSTSEEKSEDKHKLIEDSQSQPSASRQSGMTKDSHSSTRPTRPTNEYILWCQNKMAENHMTHNNVKEAMVLFSTIYDTYRNDPNYGPSHPTTKQSELNYLNAKFYLVFDGGRGDVEEAIAYFNQCFQLKKILKNLEGPPPPKGQEDPAEVMKEERVHTARVNGFRAIYLLRHGKIADAYELYGMVFNTFYQHLGKDHPETLHAFRMGELLWQKYYEDAEVDEKEDEKVEEGQRSKVIEKEAQVDDNTTAKQSGAKELKTKESVAASSSSSSGQVNVKGSDRKVEGAGGAGGAGQSIGLVVTGKSDWEIKREDKKDGQGKERSERKDMESPDSIRLERSEKDKEVVEEKRKAMVSPESLQEQIELMRKRTMEINKRLTEPNSKLRGNPVPLPSKNDSPTSTSNNVTRSIQPNMPPPPKSPAADERTDPPPPRLSSTMQNMRSQFFAQSQPIQPRNLPPNFPKFSGSIPAQPSEKSLPPFGNPGTNIGQQKELGGTSGVVPSLHNSMDNGRLTETKDMCQDSNSPASSNLGNQPPVPPPRSTCRTIGGKLDCGPGDLLLEEVAKGPPGSVVSQNQNEGEQKCKKGKNNCVLV